MSARDQVFSRSSAARRSDPKAIGVAALLGLSIAAYSVADGIGVRLSEKPDGYMGWLFLLEVAGAAWRSAGDAVFSGSAADWRVFALGLIGGVFAVVAYGLVLYAKTIAPIGAVSAVRELSVIIAALIGVLFFGERPWQGRVSPPRWSRLASSHCWRLGLNCHLIVLIDSFIG